ncbi:zinc ribbon domain-containing protein [Kitasatospora sp. GAS1066B]|uniref:zinc ribbon domain-containing protein n=1 Tax=Kitasatospora sp. GAS1066B TaxID=3156271 RepID=UPI003513CE7D
MSVSETRSRADRGECPECGAALQPERSFCDACGAFLSWSAESDTGPADTAKAGKAKADKATAGQVAAGSGRAGEEPGAAKATTAAPAAAAAEPAAGAPSPAPVREVPAREVPARQVEADTTEMPPVSLADVLATERAQALLVPVPDPAGVGPAVAPVLPGRPQENGPRVRGVVEDQVLDGIACPWCSTVNPRERHFCRRCATRFSTAEPIQAHRPWWRRVLDFRGREAPWAGQRPRLSRGPWQLVRWIVTGVLVIALVCTAVIWTGPAVQAVSDHFADPAPIQVDSMTASHSYPGHGPELTIDRQSNTWWGNGYAGQPVDTWLEAKFTAPVRLLDVIITPGTGTSPEELDAQARPHQVDLVTTDNGGQKTTTHIELSPDGPQTFSLRLHQVVSARLVILSAYGAAADKQVAIGEVEFFGTTK